MRRDFCSIYQVLRRPLFVCVGKKEKDLGIDDDKREVPGRSFGEESALRKGEEPASKEGSKIRQHIPGESTKLVREGDE